MLLRYFFDPKLAHASYMVGCPATGEALIVDPGRNIDGYLAAAEAEGLRLTGVAETHIHADFVSGGRELAQQTGARLYLSAEGGPDWQYGFASQYPSRLLHDGDTWLIGNIKFEALHTPGHTPEHMAFMITDTAGANRPMGIFTGDFVFVGDVGRPDLLEEAAGLAQTKEPGARDLFQSLQWFKRLPDYLQLWPAHGAGSACGKSLGAVPSTTLGYERLFNWAFQVESEDEFVKAILTGQPEPPRYFAIMKQVNKAGPALLGSLPRPPHLPASRLVELAGAGATIIDTRPPADFANGFVPGSLNISLDRSFNTYAGWLLDYDRPYYLLIDEGHVDEAVTDLIRIGLDNMAGFFSLGAIDQWAQQTNRPLAVIPQQTAEELTGQVTSRAVAVVDVRWATEFAEGHLPGAQHVALGYLLQRMAELPDGPPLLLYCQSGHRSTIAASLLAAHGRTHLVNLRGGYSAWTAAGQPITRN